jgi:uncharacterized delta-60 repeat protein
MNRKITCYSMLRQTARTSHASPKIPFVLAGILLLLTGPYCSSDSSSSSGSSAADASTIELAGSLMTDTAQPGAAILFVDDDGNELGSTESGSDGTWTANIKQAETPITASASVDGETYKTVVLSGALGRNHVQRDNSVPLAHINPVSTAIAAVLEQYPGESPSFLIQKGNEFLEQQLGPGFSIADFTSSADFAPPVSGGTVSRMGLLTQAISRSLKNSAPGSSPAQTFGLARSQPFMQEPGLAVQMARSLSEVSLNSSSAQTLLEASSGFPASFQTLSTSLVTAFAALSEQGGTSGLGAARQGFANDAFASVLSNQLTASVGGDLADMDASDLDKSKNLGSNLAAVLSPGLVTAAGQVTVEDSDDSTRELIYLSESAAQAAQSDGIDLTAELDNSTLDAAASDAASLIDDNQSNLDSGNTLVTFAIEVQGLGNGSVTVLFNGISRQVSAPQSSLEVNSSLADGDSWLVSIGQTSDGLFCTVTNGTGTWNTADGSLIEETVVSCTSAAPLTPDGTLDTDFGTGGILNLDNGAEQGIFNSAMDSAGNMIVTYHQDNADGAICYVSPQGSYLPGFNAGSCVVITPGSLVAGYDAFLPLDVEISPEGRIYVAGQVNNVGDTELQGVVLRLLSDGSLDTSFATGGVYLSDKACNAGSAVTKDIINEIEVDQFGNVYAAGESQANRTLDYATTMYIKLDSSGTLVSGFGTGGIACHALEYMGSSKNNWALDIALSNGTIYATGTMETDSGANRNYYLAALDVNDGSLQTDVITNGYVHHDVQGDASDWDDGVELVIDSQGRIYVSGLNFNPAEDQNFFTARHLSDGSLDTTWASAATVPGILEYNNSGTSQDRLVDSILDYAGRLILVGHIGNGSAADAFVIRLDEDGAMDSSFGSGGIAMFNDLNGTGNDEDDVIDSIKIAQDGSYYLFTYHKDTAEDPNGDLYILKMK